MQVELLNDKSPTPGCGPTEDPLGPTQCTPSTRSFLSINSHRIQTYFRASRIASPPSPTMLAPRTGRQALQRAVAASPSSTVTLPGFLVPAFQAQPTSRRNFSATTTRPSKLGRTPLSIPPGVELVIGEPFVKKDVTSYLKTYKRKVTVTGPLGEQCSSGVERRDSSNWPGS